MSRSGQIFTIGLPIRCNCVLGSPVNVTILRTPPGRVMPDTDIELALFYQLSKAGIELEDAKLLKKYFEATITEVVTKAISALKIPEHNCPIPTTFQKQIIPLIASVESVGEGNLAHGIERQRDNHRFITKLRRAQGKVGMIVLTSLFGTIVIGICMAIWSYAKVSVGVTK